MNLKFLGDGILNKPSNKVDITQIKKTSFIENLEILRKHLHMHNGSGIAAPQIGWDMKVILLGIDANYTYDTNTIGKFCLKTFGDTILELRYWLNPEIIFTSDEQVYCWEGCLSIPNKYGWIKRPETVIVKGWDENGIQLTKTYSGITSRLVQHEIDHINGQLFVDRVACDKFIVPDEAFDDPNFIFPSKGTCQTKFGELSPIE